MYEQSEAKEDICIIEISYGNIPLILIKNKTGVFLPKLNVIIIKIMFI